MHWQSWLGDGEAWAPFFDDLTTPEGTDLLSALRARGLLFDAHVERIQTLRRSAEGRAVPLPGERPLDNELIALLAGGFSSGEKGRACRSLREVG